jgi:hypothetical protein
MAEERIDDHDRLTTGDEEEPVPAIVELRLRPIREARGREAVEGVDRCGSDRSRRH